MKTGLRVEGSSMGGALAELGGQASPGYSETILPSRRRADRRQAAPVSLITVISWAIKQQRPGQPLKEGLSAQVRFLQAA